MDVNPTDLVLMIGEQSVMIRGLRRENAELRRQVELLTEAAKAKPEPPKPTELETRP